MVSWDEPKRRFNLKKHGIDLADLESAFDFFSYGPSVKTLLT